MARSGRPRVRVEPHNRVIEATPVVRARARRIKWLRRQLGGKWERREKWRKRRGKLRKIYQWRKRWDFARQHKFADRLNKIVEKPIKKSAIHEIDFADQEKQREAIIVRKIDLNRP